MSDNIPPPKSIKADPQSLHIEWSDGVTHVLPWKLLREQCPCATCRDERTQPAEAKAEAADDPFPIISVEEARPVTVRSMVPVGNYAYGIDFTDGHTTGIYRLEYLRQLGEAVDEARSNQL